MSRAKEVLERTHLDGWARSAWRGLYPYVNRHFGRVDRRLATTYLRDHRDARLHIGCGANCLRDWLNSDYFPKSSRILHLDATRPFPFPDGQFRYVFCEHMIEHVTYAEGSFMLAECHRVLQPGGKVRISTPDLSFLIHLHTREKSALERRYIEWATATYVKDAPYPDDVFVINNFVRDWGHTFIYDEKTLRRVMETAGFKDIVKCDLSESEEAGLRDLENDRRMPEGFLRLETITLEGRK